MDISLFLEFQLKKSQSVFPIACKQKEKDQIELEEPEEIGEDGEIEEEETFELFAQRHGFSLSNAKKGKISYNPRFEIPDPDEFQIPDPNPDDFQIPADELEIPDPNPDELEIPEIAEYEGISVEEGEIPNQEGEIDIPVEDGDFLTEPVHEKPESSHLNFIHETVQVLRSAEIILQQPEQTEETWTPQDYPYEEQCNEATLQKQKRPIEHDDDFEYELYLAQQQQRNPYV
jgi:hypothetical protein